MTRTALLLCALFASGCLLSPDPAGCSASSCDECIELAGCGWCPSLGCVAGNPTEPYAAGLYCEDDYRWDECTLRPPRIDPCAVHAAPDQCALAASCAWCGTRRACQLESVPCGWARTGATPASSHPYDNSADRSWPLGVPAHATMVRVQIVRVELEGGYDFVEFMDGETVVHTLSGGEDGQVVNMGRATSVRLRSDGSVQRWGFEIGWIEYQ